MTTNFGSESVVDLRLIKIGTKSIYQRKIINADGSEVWQDEVVAAETCEDFNPHTEVAHSAESCVFDKIDSETHFKPNDFPGVNTDVLIRKEIQKIRNTISIDKELVQDYMDRLIKLHAILIRITGTSPETILDGHYTCLDKLKKNTALREAVLLIIDVVGEPWLSIKDKI